MVQKAFKSWRVCSSKSKISATKGNVKNVLFDKEVNLSQLFISVFWFHKLNQSSFAISKFKWKSAHIWSNLKHKLNKYISDKIKILYLCSITIKVSPTILLGFNNTFMTAASSRKVSVDFVQAVVLWAWCLPLGRFRGSAENNTWSLYDLYWPHKAFDSVSHTRLWLILRKTGWIS